MNTTMNVTNQTQGAYNPEDPSTPAALLWVALVHCYCVTFMGTLGNAVALWCVATCKKARKPMKVMLFSVFVPVLVICLVTRPVVAEMLLSSLTHGPTRVSKSVAKINSVVYSVLAQTELAAIAAVAVVRAVSIWAPQKPSLKLRGTVLLVIAIGVYSILTGVGLEGLFMLDKPWTTTLITILFFLNTTLPAIITAAAYILMIYVIQRNKRRLANSQKQARATTVMDQATRATLAVFISNLVFGLPHSIYHLMGRQPHYMHVIFHVLFSTHFVVDPLAFVWFNSGYRRYVLSGVRKVTQSIASSTTSSVLPGGPVSRSDHLQSTTNKQEDISV